MTKQLQMNNAALPAASAQAQKFSTYGGLSEIKEEYSSSSSAMTSFPFAPPTAPMSSMTAGNPFSFAPPTSPRGLGGVSRAYTHGVTSDLLSMPHSSGSSDLFGPDPFSSGTAPPPRFGGGSSSSFVAKPFAPAIPQPAHPSGGFTFGATGGSGGLADYNVQEQKIDLAQAQRLVQTSMMTSGLQDRMKKC